ncbi:MAG: serine--tRNA ligase [Candidatus Binatia bacterium]
MLDIRAIRERPDFFRSELAKVGYGAEELGALLAADERRRRLIHDVERRRAERAKGSREIAKIEDAAARATAVAEMKRAGEDLGRVEKELAEAESGFERLLLEVPNLPHPAVPVGRDERDNRVVRTEGDEPRRDFTPRPHWEIGPELGVLDFERGVKISGSRFYILLDAGARLQRALIAWMIDLHVREHGYVEVYPPAMVKRECLVGTGNLPKFGENLYRDAEEDLWFVPTAEVPVTNLYRDEILDAARLPLLHVAYTPCFRREKMSAGRDVRGIKRGHQFDKVEMVKFVHPDQSDAELSSLLDAAAEVCRRLGLRHRIVEMCTGDLSFTAARKFDIEVWAAGCEEWLEVSSCSNFRDFQARRANIRFRPSGGGKPELVHTLNGSGLALPRVLIAILENFQSADGTITVPEVLRPYAGGMSVIVRRPS